MRIYLASPFFNEKEINVYDKVIEKLRAEGHEVYVPREHEQEGAWKMSNKVWGLKTFQDDVNAIQESDEVWVINHGMYSDSGTAWECGFAYGIGKTVRMLLCSDCQDLGVFDVPTFSLMMVNGCDEYDAIGNYLANTDVEIEINQK